MEVLWFSPLESTRSLLMWGIFLGILAAMAYLIGIRARNARTVKRLLEKECGDEAAARAPEELGLSPAALARAEKSGLAARTEDGRGYIPAEKREKAAYFAGKLQWKWWQAALCAVLFYAAMLGLHALLPLLLDR